MLQIGDILAKDLRETFPDLLKVNVHSFPDWNVPVAAYLETFYTDHINPEYLLWLERDGETSPNSPPCCVSKRTANLIAQVEQRFQSYGGISCDMAKPNDPDEFYFIYYRPRLDLEELLVGIKIAAMKAGMTSSRFRKFWCQHSERIREDMSQYANVLWYSDSDCTMMKDRAVVSVPACFSL
jgi:hypothetical protein